MVNRPDGDQFHFDPATYLERIRAEVPAYDELQDAVAKATAGIQAERVLELGVGTGETSRRVLDLHPEAVLVGIDESVAMLAVASANLAADLRVSRLEDPLPKGNFDLVVSALAVHHLDGAGKADLFARVADRLRPGGRFVLGDVVVPDDPADVITPIDGVYDQPSTTDDQVRWLAGRRLGHRGGRDAPGPRCDRRPFAVLMPARANARMTSGRLVASSRPCRVCPSTAARCSAVAASRPFRISTSQQVTANCVLAAGAVPTRSVAAS
jgi:tRNA (cmo5U34)-methyltransferase